MREKSLVINIRITPGMLDRIDRLTEFLSRPGNPSTRSYALRYVIIKGLDTAEAARGLNRSQRARAKRP
jgi:predicted DNA-binding protein